MTSTVGKLMTASIKNHFIEGNPGIKFNFLALFFCITTLVSFFQMLMAMIYHQYIDDGDDTILFLGLFWWFP